VGATRANDFLRQANEYGQTDGDHASSRTDPDDAERLTGIYGIDGHSTSGPGCATSVPEAADHEGQSRALRRHPHGCLATKSNLRGTLADTHVLFKICY
jgi:hypothetical protein